MNQPHSWTIERSYTDAFGRRHDVPPDDLERIAGFLGRSNGHEAPDPPAVAHARAYQPDFVAEGRRLWLLAVQLYAVRSRRNWGHGDFTDLRHLLEFAADIGAAGIGVNPLHALPLGQPSPYSPSSRLFLNPLYIDIEALAEFRRADALGLRDELDRLRKADLVDYSRVAALKARALRHAHWIF